MVRNAQSQTKNGSWNDVAGLMMINFRESGHPLFRGTSAFCQKALFVRDTVTGGYPAGVRTHTTSITIPSTLYLYHKLRITSYPIVHQHHIHVQSHLSGSSFAHRSDGSQTLQELLMQSLDLHRDAVRGRLACSVRSPFLPGRQVHFTQATLVVQVAGISQLPLDIG